MTQSSYAYHKRWRYDAAHGRKRTADATPARNHIASCVGQGMSLRAIAGASGVSVPSVCKILGGQTTARITTIAKILAVRPGPTREACRDTSEPFVPAIGTRRRIQALLAIGWRHSDISAVAGHQSAVAMHQKGRWVTRTKHDNFAKAYRELSGRPGPSEKTRRLAKKLGYVGPLAWEDIDRDPTPEPDLEDERLASRADVDPVVVERALSGESPGRTTIAERRAIVRAAHALGMNDQEISRRTGLSDRAVLRIRQELGLPTPTIAA